MKILFSLMFFLLLCSSSALFAQDSAKEPIIVATKNCESNIAHLWNLIGEAEKTKERLFVIARLGKGETSRNLLHRRLFNARTYITPRLKSGDTVFAEGEPSTNEGRV
jgi:hypothetical protein